ncbi:MAG: hypothetical protein HRF52_13660 [Ignavibacterium sp.]|jgi:hypothetical protein|uniref:hypothetical protein n=1 Tax=Ignavibacterium sp. TaxID=2651167 RepID=UPI003296CBBF
MKAVKIAGLILLGFLFFACDKEDSNDPNSLGGDVNTEISNVGDEFFLSVKVGDDYVDLNDTIKVVSNNNGLVTFKIKANVSQSNKIKQLLDKIPGNVYDSQGNIDAEVQFKITTAGIQDFFNKDQKPHTLVKYDAKVGDQYKLTKSDGKTITRTVTARSDANDFPYGFYYIKTITLEQDSRIPGIQKFVYRANHKFGIVYLEIYLEDGSKVSSYIFAPNS